MHDGRSSCGCRPCPEVEWRNVGASVSELAPSKISAPWEEWIFRCLGVSKIVFVCLFFFLFFFFFFSFFLFLIFLFSRSDVVSWMLVLNRIYNYVSDKIVMAVLQWMHILLIFHSVFVHTAGNLSTDTVWIISDLWIYFVEIVVEKLLVVLFWFSRVHSQDLLPHK